MPTAEDLLLRGQAGTATLAAADCARRARLPRALAQELQGLRLVAGCRNDRSSLETCPIERLTELFGNAVQNMGAEDLRRPRAIEQPRSRLAGVSTAEISSQTMESSRQPGLYFVGEVLDVTGHLGGFNFPVGLGFRTRRRSSCLTKGNWTL